MSRNITEIVSKYNQNGYLFPLDAMSPEQALAYRSQFEAAEREYKDKDKDKDPDFDALVFGHANMVLPFIDEITRLPDVLDPVKAILGPDVLVWGVNLFIKEAESPNYVSWHQDLTYWDLNDVEEVTAWIALSPATVNNGCMRFAPGTHTREIVSHHDTFARANQLSRGQEIEVKVDESETVNVVLSPGQMSLHHGRIFHASHANRTTDRRIGLAIRYITPAMHQLSGVKSYVTLVSGEDRFGHFNLVPAPIRVMDPADLAMARQAVEAGEKFLYAGAGGQGQRRLSRE